MTESNPMKNPVSVARLKKWRYENPEKIAAINKARTEGSRRIQKDKPTKLELRAFAILDKLGISYESYFVIKDRFVVDVKVSSLIIQLDGDYWHGHPRLEPLSDRQISQKKRDVSQDAYLKACGFQVERIWERDLSESIMISTLCRHGLLEPNLVGVPLTGIVQAP